MCRGPPFFTFNSLNVMECGSKTGLIHRTILIVLSVRGTKWHIFILGGTPRICESAKYEPANNKRWLCNEWALTLLTLTQIFCKINLVLAIYELCSLNFIFYLCLSERSGNLTSFITAIRKKCHSSFARKRPVISPFREAIAFSKSTPKGSHSMVKWIHVPKPYVMGSTVVNSGSLHKYFSDTNTLCCTGTQLLCDCHSNILSSPPFSLPQSNLPGTNFLFINFQKARTILTCPLPRIYMQHAPLPG